MSARPSRFLSPLLFLALSGCALPYYWQAARGQASLLRQREPIEELLASPALETTTREQLALVAGLRRFAVTELALPDNDSYTSFVDLDRDFVVFNVVAAPEFSIEPVTWCFPIAGCVSYRGYFDRERAVKFESRLRERGFDTFLGGATAYSTLGYFADPVLDTMLRRGDTEIAATLFHELAHQRLYIKDDTELSESLATAVEQYGVERWLVSRGDDGGLAAYRASLERRGEFAGLVARYREALAGAFAAGADPAAMRRAKSEIYDRMRREYASLRQAWGGHTDFDGWFGDGLNNATLVALSSYQRWVPGLRRELDRQGPEAFFMAMSDLVELDSDERRAVLESWNQESVAGALPDPGELVGIAAEVSGNDRLHAFRHHAEGREAVVAAHARNRQ